MKKVILSMVMCFALVATTTVMAQSAPKTDKKSVVTEVKAEKKAETQTIKTEAKKLNGTKAEAKAKVLKTEKKATEALKK